MGMLAGAVALIVIGGFCMALWVLTSPTPEQRAKRAAAAEAFKAGRQRYLDRGEPIPPLFMTPEELRANGHRTGTDAGIADGRD